MSYNRLQCVVYMCNYGHSVIRIYFHGKYSKHNACKYIIIIDDTILTETESECYNYLETNRSFS